MANVCFRCRQPGHWASKCPLINTCFNCKKHGHWASQCPDKQCDFCGHKGHSSDNCEMKKKLTIPVPTTVEEVSSTRTRHITLDLADIMFNCHLEKGFTKEMENQVTSLVNNVCKKGIDEYLLADYVFVKNRNAFMLADMGHMEVVGFIIKKYLSADNEILKTFLREMHEEIPGEFNNICNRLFALTVVQKRNGTLCFRKFTGMLCANDYNNYNEEEQYDADFIDDSDDSVSVSSV